MDRFVEIIITFIKEAVSSAGYWGIGAGMFLESACIPIPSELILPLSGFMAADGYFNILTANIVVALGSLAGSFFAYAVGFLGGRPLILKYGKYLLISDKKFYHAEGVFNRYGSTAVFFGRLLPIVRTFISLPAGISRMNPCKFFTFSLLGMLPWNFALISLGFKFGQNYDTLIHPILKRYEYVTVLLLTAAAAFFILKRLVKMRK